MIKIGFIGVLPEDNNSQAITGPAGVSFNLIQAFGEIPGVKCDLLHALRPLPLAKRIQKVTKTIAAIVMQQPDVILLSGFAPNISLLVAFLSRFTQTQTVYIAHGLVFVEDPNNRLAVLVEGLLLRLVSQVVAISYSEKRTLLERYPEVENKTTVIPHGISVEFVVSNADRIDKEPYVLFVGKRSKSKGLDTLIHALDSLQLPLKLVIAGGEGDCDDELYASDLYKRGMVTVLGRIRQPDLRQWYRNAALFVLPSRYESFGLVVLEAMAAGCATILSENVGAVDFLTPGVNCLTFPVGDSAALAARILQLIENPSQVQAVGKAGWVTAKKSTWQTTAARYIELFQSLLDGK